jgi:hypothetical protein
MRHETLGRSPVFIDTPKIGIRIGAMHIIVDAPRARRLDKVEKPLTQLFGKPALGADQGCSTLCA